MRRRWLFGFTVLLLCQCARQPDPPTPILPEEPDTLSLTKMPPFQQGAEACEDLSSAVCADPGLQTERSERKKAFRQIQNQVYQALRDQSVLIPKSWDEVLDHPQQWRTFFSRYLQELDNKTYQYASIGKDEVQFLFSQVRTLLIGRVYEWDRLSVSERTRLVQRLRGVRLMSPSQFFQTHGIEHRHRGLWGSCGPDLSFEGGFFRAKENNQGYPAALVICPDTIVKSHSAEDLLWVLAHELGHAIDINRPGNSKHYMHLETCLASHLDDPHSITDYMGEIVADYWAAEVGALWLKGRTPTETLKTLKRWYVGRCEMQKRKGYFQDHPPPRYRIDTLVSRHPHIRVPLGCEKKPVAKNWCSL